MQAVQLRSNHDQLVEEEELLVREIERLTLEAAPADDGFATELVDRGEQVIMQQNAERYLERATRPPSAPRARRARRSLDRRTLDAPSSRWGHGGAGAKPRNPHGAADELLRPYYVFPSTRRLRWVSRYSANQVFDQGGSYATLSRGPVAGPYVREIIHIRSDEHGSAPGCRDG
jgi:hypothetical protein